MIYNSLLPEVNASMLDYNSFYRGTGLYFYDILQAEIKMLQY